MATKVLVADDSATIQKVVKIAFARLSYEIVEAISYPQAANLLDAGPVPSVVILDANLPGLQGPPGIRKLIGDTKVPVLLLVGTYDTIDEESYRKAGFSHFLKKPFESTDIVAGVEKLLASQGGGSSGPQAAQPAQAAPPLAPFPPVLKPMSPSSQPPPPHPVGQAAGSLRPSLGTPPGPPPLGKGLPAPRASAPESLPPPQPVVPTSLDLGTPFELNIQSPQPPSHQAPPPPLPRPPSRVTEGLPAGDFSLDRVFDRVSDPFDVVAPLPSSPVPPPEKISERITEKAPEKVLEKVPEKVPEKPPQFSPERLVEMRKEIQADIRSEIIKQIKAELPALVSQAIHEYCDLHFGPLAKAVITDELRRLAEEKTRQLVDN